MLAFAVRNFVTKEALDDPSKVEWLVGIYEGDGLTEKMTHQIGVHKCNK